MSEFKDNWIKALRSGEYGQIRFQLKRAEGYCCLGVAAEITDNLSSTPNEDGCYLTKKGSYTLFQGPNDELDCEFNGDPLVNVLTRMNDGRRMSFNEIADFLENLDF